MNSIQPTSSPVHSTDADAQRIELDSHIEAGKQCETFFSTKWAPKDFPLAHYQYMPAFSKIFRCVSEGKLEEWKNSCQIIPENNPLSEKELIPIEKLQICEDANSIISTEKKESVQEELKIKIELIEKTNEVFCKKIIALLQNNAKILLQGELNRTGEHIFFLPALQYMDGGIGECHCCEYMNREHRRNFSYQLIGEIATTFPDKKSISIASIGAGTCFNELEIHAMAHKEGYEVSEWVIIDPIIQPKTIKNFETIAKWATPNTTVTSVCEKADSYFISLENKSAAPDVFLFIDVDLHISEPAVQRYSEKLNQVGLFVYFSKQEEYPEYYDSKVKK